MTFTYKEQNLREARNVSKVSQAVWSGANRPDCLPYRSRILAKCRVLNLYIRVVLGGIISPILRMRKLSTLSKFVVGFKVMTV